MDDVFDSSKSLEDQKIQIDATNHTLTIMTMTKVCHIRRTCLDGRYLQTHPRERVISGVSEFTKTEEEKKKTCQRTCWLNRKLNDSSITSYTLRKKMKKSRRADWRVSRSRVGAIDTPATPYYSIRDTLADKIKDPTRESGFHPLPEEEYIPEPNPEDVDDEHNPQRKGTC